MRINIISETRRRIPRKKIKNLMVLIEEEEDPPDSILNIILARDHLLKKLNRQYRGMSRATDVLSFAIDTEFGEGSVLGEVYISTDRAEASARAIGISFTSEVLRLCCHGVLHLLGYDHTLATDREAMQAREEYYLGRLHS